MKECWQALKNNDEPVLLMASVGAGKSLMIADILIAMQKAGKRALCLVNNAQLVRNNCATFITQGGKSSIYCAALGSKDDSAPVVFGTPKSVLNAIDNKESLADIKFNIIVVDEADSINYAAPRSCFMRILRYYKQEYPGMRVLGATGTPFRFKGTTIVGENCLFKSQVGNITTEWLIKEGYLVNPDFEIDKELVIDFSRVKIKNNGKFDSKQLAQVVDENARLTELICKQIIHIMESQNRHGVFIFATTKKHALEIISHLPPAQSALILGETKEHERTEILNKAHDGSLRYIVNIAIIGVGIDLPPFDTLAYLRPTESLRLLIQTMGRILRLSPVTAKDNALVLDFAGNIERHSQWDNPILLKAVKQALEHDKPKVIKCPACYELNTESARRCVGITNDKRCDYFFEFKECPNQQCKVKNDLAARHCRQCETELIDPNKKLSLALNESNLKEMTVLGAQYGISDSKTGFRVNCMYRCINPTGKTVRFYESYTPISEKAKHVFYGQFIKKHCQNPSEWYPHLATRSKMEHMLHHVNTPLKIMLKIDDSGYRIKRKVFAEVAENSSSTIT